MAMLTYLQLRAAPSKREKLKKLRLGLWLSLIFFVLLFITSCNSNEGRNPAFLYADDKAKALTVPIRMIPANSAGQVSNSAEELKRNLSVVLKSTAGGSGPEVAPMLGEYNVTDSNIVFTPIVPFTPGNTYVVLYQNKPVTEVSVPLPDAASAPVIRAVYPSPDTLPENLLKLYIVFSAPMREGEAVRHIKLISYSGDTLDDTFLNLQPELWNDEANVLTVWFDPGRIKRDLIPNVEKGNPLTSGRHYTLAIDSSWKSVNGLTLQRGLKRRFFITDRDSVSPQPAQWRFSEPIAGSSEPLKVSFTESLDYFLLHSAFSIVDANAQPVTGSVRVMHQERAIEFTPSQKWIPGKFIVKVSSILEDISGNNLNRPFERDNLRDDLTTDKNFFEIRFSVPPVVESGNP